MAPSLRDLADLLKSLDPKNILRDHAYHLDTTNQLGFKPDDPLDFYVAIPFGSWGSASTNLPSLPKQNVLAAAIVQALREGLTSGNYMPGPGNQKYVLIDMCNFAHYSIDFFNNDETEGIFGTLCSLVNALPHDVVPIVRILAGDHNVKASSFQEDRDTDTSWLHYRRLFWKNGKQSFTHPNSRLYIGWYNPDHEIDLDSILNKLYDLAEKVFEHIEDCLEHKSPGANRAHTNELPSFVKTYASALSRALKVPGLPAISWNHAKLVAVNGVAMTTGGANQWDDYGNGKSDVFDSTFRIKGDAVLQGHRYADAMWDYLNTLPQRDDDDSSMLFTRLLARAPPQSAKDFTVSKAPLFKDMSPQSIPNKGTQSVLTVSNVGDEFPDGIRYPLQSLNLLRDIILNLAWLELKNRNEIYTTLGLPPLIDALSDQSISSLLQEYKISPVAWASKITRLHAIEKAQDHIILYQQELVNEDIKESASSVISILKKDLGLDWDGNIIPIDLFLAIARGLKTIVEKHPDDTSYGVQILISSISGGYGAPYSWKATTTILERMLASIFVADPGQVVQDRVQCKRIMSNTDAHHNHSKMVCVDGSLLYAGSDNAYPQYNEQHGVWIEDKKNIAAWHDQFWVDAWKRSTIATD